MSQARCDEADAALIRQVLEFLVILLISVLMLRTFAAEAYVVPTGSMAPTLLGIHQDITCPNCGHRFSIGQDELARGGQPACPSCATLAGPDAPSQGCNGDRLLVQKFLYDLRPPRRWEVVVFQSPTEPEQPYVKRVVGLPGDTLRIEGGDVYINGQPAHRDLETQRAMRVLIHDSAEVPRDEMHRPHWYACRGSSRGAPEPGTLARRQATNWVRQGDWFVLESQAYQTVATGDRDRGRGPSGFRSRRSLADRGDSIDWLIYRHRVPGVGDSGPVRDFHAYNGVDHRNGNVVRDLMLEADLRASVGVERLFVQMRHGLDQFLIGIPVGRPGDLVVMMNGSELGCVPDFEPIPVHAQETVKLEASLFDRRLCLAIDGELAFEPIDLDPAVSTRLAIGELDRLSEPIALGARGEGLIVERARIYRDLYYTDRLAARNAPAHGIDAPVQLGPGEYFVLGDNSAESNDSRFWPDSPVVRHDMLLGKPFLVHLPSQVVPLKVFGRTTYWIPDPREIRYIR